MGELAVSDVGDSSSPCRSRRARRCELASPAGARSALWSALCLRSDPHPLAPSVLIGPCPSDPSVSACAVLLNRRRAVRGRGGRRRCGLRRPIRWFASVVPRWWPRLWFGTILRNSGTASHARLTRATSAKVDSTGLRLSAQAPVAAISTPTSAQAVPYQCLKHRPKPVVSGQQGAAPLRHGSCVEAALSCADEQICWSGRGAGDRDRTGMASLESGYRAALFHVP